MVYPTYDFACPFVDALEGVTHALRTSEYKDREAQFYWVLKEQQKAWPGLPNVTIWDYARLNFVYTLLSKRKLTWFVESGRVEGWNDARMPTVQGMLRRGLTLEALKEFIIGQGASKNITYQEWDKIWSINKRIIDPISPRHTAVEQAGKVTVKLSGAPSTAERATVPKHKKNAAVGTKELVKLDTILIDQVDAALLAENEEITLMDWGNAIIKAITRDASGAVTAVEAQLHLEGDFKKTKLKLTWLSAVPELVPLTLVEFGYLINKKKLDEDDDFEAHVSDVTRLDTPALGDINMAALAAGDVIQLERKGYYRVDAPAANGQPAVLYNIPDGRMKTMMGGVAGQLPNKQ